jgi:hypothetical protein
MDILYDLSFLDVIDNLKKISETKINEKLIIYNNAIEIDNRYMQFIARWYYANSRIQTLEFIKKLYKKSLYYYHNLVKFNNHKNDSDSKILTEKLTMITNELNNSIKGLNNLKDTYINDLVFTKEIELLILDINNIISIKK